MLSRFKSHRLDTFRQRIGFIALHPDFDLGFPFLVSATFALMALVAQLELVGEEWNGVLRIPTAVNALTAVINAGLMALGLYLCVRWKLPCSIKRIQFAIKVNVLLAIVGLAFCVMSGWTVGWSKNVLKITGLLEYNFVVTICALSGTRLLRRITK